MLKVVPNLAHEVHHFHSPGFLHYLWMATSSHSISKPLLASTWTTSTLIKDSGSAWSTKTLEYFRIMPKIAPKFQDFFGICEDDIILNEDTQEFLSLDLPTLFYSNEIDFKKIKSDAVESVVKAAFVATQMLQSNSAAVDELARALFRMFRFSRISLLLQNQVALDLKMSNSFIKIIPDICF